MISGIERARLASAIEALMRGELDTVDFESLELRSANDSAITSIHAFVCALYDDDDLTLDRSKLSTEEIEAINRCILFLKSDLEYLWPRIQFSRPLQFLLGISLVSVIGGHISAMFVWEPYAISLVVFGLLLMLSYWILNRVMSIRTQRNCNRAKGNVRVWPFFTESDVVGLPN